MNMTSTISKQSLCGSSTNTVSTPVIGEEYVLVKKADKLKEESKEEKKVSLGYAKVGYGNGGGRFGACEAVLTYDFAITPGTSSTFQTVVALAPAQDTMFSSHWKVLFSAMRMKCAEVQLDFTEFINSVGHDVALSPVILGYAPSSFANTQYYADVSDYKTAKMAGYSTARPVVTFKVPPKWIQGWTNGQEATSVDVFHSRWIPTNFSAFSPHCGYVHVASQKVMFDVERSIVGRLKMWMIFKGQL